MRAKESGQSALFLLDVVDVLNRLKVGYAVIGAFAASFYGSVRASLDADAVISLKDTAGIRHLTVALTDQGWKAKYRKGDMGDPIAGVINVQDRFGNRVDLLTGIKGISEEVFSRVLEADFMGATIKIVGLEDLIAMKVFAGSAKDIDDVTAILEVSSKTINKPLLREIAVHYGKQTVRKLESLLIK